MGETVAFGTREDPLAIICRDFVIKSPSEFNDIFFTGFGLSFNIGFLAVLEVAELGEEFLGLFRSLKGLKSSGTSIGLGVLDLLAAVFFMLSLMIEMSDPELPEVKEELVVSDKMSVIL